MVRYRWVVLGVTMLVNAVIQTLWIATSAVTETAARFYGVDDTMVGAFAMTFMVAFIPLSIPAAALIDRRGVRFAVGLGCVLAAIGGLGRGLAGDAYWVAFAFNVLIAGSQPLLLNAWAATAAAWFDRSSRATASGLITLANLLGTALGMAVTPGLTTELGVGGMQTCYGAIMAVSAVAFVLLVRDRPPVSPDADADGERALVTAGLGHALRVRPLLELLAGVFVLMGAFNGVMTWVVPILGPRGFSEDDAGAFAAVALLVGIAGALVLSRHSDRSGRRVPCLVVAAAGAVPGVLGVAFAPTFPTLLLAGVFLGFFLTGALPVAIEYAAEIARPTPEGTSNGLLQLAGQASVLLVFAMNWFRPGDGSYTPALLALAGLLVVGVFVLWRLPEPAAYLAAAGPGPDSRRGRRARDEGRRPGSARD